MKNLIITLLVLIFFFPSCLLGQLETQWLDTTSHSSRDNAMFFTNRPLKFKEGGAYDFKNKYTRQSDNLYFCLFNYKNDSIYLKYQVLNKTGDFPRGEVESNPFYTSFSILAEEKGIKRFYIIVPGYSKTFDKQVHDYMYRIKKIYTDSIKAHTVAVTFAWGNEWRAPLYYRAKRSARKAAHDFAIFQHLLEDFLADSAYHHESGLDFEINLLCSSMGNQLFKQYLFQREKAGVDLVKVYNHISFFGSDASWDSFEEGKGFDRIDLMTDSVAVYVNSRDTPLRLSQILNPKPRMGLTGPKHPGKLPPFVEVINITPFISKEDIPGLGHDYLLSNPILRESILNTLMNY